MFSEELTIQPFMNNGPLVMTFSNKQVRQKILQFSKTCKPENHKLKYQVDNGFKIFTWIGYSQMKHSTWFKSKTLVKVKTFLKSRY